MTEGSDADRSLNFFIIASEMCFYDYDVRTVGEPRLAPCREKPETPPGLNRWGKVPDIPLPQHSSHSAENIWQDGGSKGEEIIWMISLVNANV